jgi:hypothetical protein
MNALKFQIPNYKFQINTKHQLPMTEKLLTPHALSHGERGRKRVF